MAIFLPGHGRAEKNQYHALRFNLLAIANGVRISNGALSQEMLDKLLPRFATSHLLLLLEAATLDR